MLLARRRLPGGDGEDPAEQLQAELIEENASTLRRYVLAHAAANGLPDAFVVCVEKTCTFHDTLVDRIVPRYPRVENADVHGRSASRTGSS